MSRPTCKNCGGVGGVIERGFASPCPVCEPKVSQKVIIERMRESMTNPPNYSELMNELWKASEGGTAEWWPKELGVSHISDGVLATYLMATDDYRYLCDIPHKDAYFIATGYANEWLRAKWVREGSMKEGTKTHFFGDSLPAALAYAQQQGATDETN